MKLLCLDQYLHQYVSVRKSHYIGKALEFDKVFVASKKSWQKSSNKCLKWAFLPTHTVRKAIKFPKTADMNANWASRNTVELIDSKLTAAAAGARRESVGDSDKITIFTVEIWVR